MRKHCEENERMKRSYFYHLRHADGKDEATIDKIAAALTRFEDATRFKPFKEFHIEKAVSFKEILRKARNPKTGKPLSKATISATLRSVKAFFQWLSYQPGFKSRVRLPDAEYFNLSAKDEAAAHAHRETPFPSMEQALHAFRQMPDNTDIEMRNKALFAFLILTGVRVAAAASLKLKHIDLDMGQVFQDAREVRTKASKTIYTTFFPVADDVLDCFERWVKFLRKDRLFGPDDPLFPKTAVRSNAQHAFAAVGLERAHWATAAPIRKIIGDAFQVVGLRRFGPHTFRKTIEQWGAARYVTPEAFKALSQNLGHESVLTTFTSYGQVSRTRQAEIIRSAN